MTRKKSVINEVASYLRQEITSSRYKSGQHIKEIEIAKKLNVSRVPVREAFRILQSEGYVEVIANRGSFVKKVTYKYLKEMATFYKLLLPVLLEKAIPNYTKTTYTKAYKILDKIDECEDMGVIGYLLWDFGKIIYRPSGMKFILGLFDDIYMHNIRTLNELFELKLTEGYNTSAHRRFLKLCSEKKNSKAIKCWQEHVDKIEKLTFKKKNNKTS